MEKNDNKNFTKEEALVDSKPVTRGLALLAQSWPFYTY